MREGGQRITFQCFIHEAALISFPCVTQNQEHGGSGGNSDLGDNPSTPAGFAWKDGQPITLPYVTLERFRAGDRASGPDFGHIPIGKASKSALRPAEGWSEGRI